MPIEKVCQGCTALNPVSLVYNLTEEGERGITVTEVHFTESLTFQCSRSNIELTELRISIVQDLPTQRAVLPPWVTPTPRQCGY